MRSERRIYLGAHVTRAVKRALVAVARNRKTSVSALTSSILAADLGIKTHVEAQAAKRAAR